MNTFGSTVPRLRFVRYTATMLLLGAALGCQSTQLERYETAQPVSIGLRVPKVSGPNKELLGSPEEWQRQIKECLEATHICARVVAINPKEEDQNQAVVCDIVVEPLVTFPKLDELSNNKGAILANVVWFATYFGYFFFSDMTLDDAGRLGFNVSSFDGKKALVENEKVVPPELDLRFGQRDSLFTSRFFMTLFLFPALHPMVCSVIGIKQNDSAEVGREVRARMSSAMAGEIAKFVNLQLANKLQASGLPSLLTTSLKLTRQGKLLRLAFVVHAPENITLKVDSVELEIFGKDGKPTEVTSVGAPIPNSAASTWQYEFDVNETTALKEVRIYLVDPITFQRVAYTVPPERLLQPSDPQALAAKK